MAINSVSFQCEPFGSSKMLMCDEPQKKSNKIHQLTFVYVDQMLTKKAVPHMGSTTSTHDGADEQLVRCPALRPSSSNNVLKSI